MKKWSQLAGIIKGLLLFLVSSPFVIGPCPALAHLCHDPFRPREHLVISPEKELISIETEGVFRIYVENSFSTTLRDLRLIVKNPAFDIEVEPEVLGRLAPGERTSFSVRLRLQEGSKPGNYPLRIRVDARSAEIRPTIERMDITVKERVSEIQPKIEPEEYPKIHPEIQPPEVQPEIQSEIQPPEVQPEGRPKIEPEAQPRVQPQPTPRIRPEDVVKEEIKIEPERAVEVETEEEEGEEIQEEVGEIVVVVEEIPFWKKPYFYITLIIFLVAILIWRKLK